MHVFYANIPLAGGGEQSVKRALITMIWSRFRRRGTELWDKSVTDHLRIQSGQDISMQTNLHNLHPLFLHNRVSTMQHNQPIHLSAFSETNKQTLKKRKEDSFFLLTVTYLCLKHFMCRKCQLISIKPNVSLLRFKPFKYLVRSMRQVLTALGEKSIKNTLFSQKAHLQMHPEHN